jgi:hypothetical protein
MRRPDDNAEDARIADNVRRTIELTELALALRASAVRQDDPNCDSMGRVMREIRRVNDLAWQKSTKR